MTNQKSIISIISIIFLIVVSIFLYILIPRLNTNTTTQNMQENNNPLYITTMTHYEGNWDIDKNFFNNIIANSEFGMDMADKYNAKLTFESEKPFALASIEFERNYLQEILDRGHGVGTHCDFGIFSKADSFSTYYKEVLKNKTMIDKLIGAKNNLGCSGGGGAQDWVLGLSKTGFSYIDGIVGAHYLSMPLENRPDGWTDDYIYSSGYHENAPYDLNERIYPIWLKDATDFEEDENGTIALMDGDLGRLSEMAEGDDISCDNKRCEFNKKDVDAAIKLIKQILEMRDPNKFAKITFFLSTADLSPNNKKTLEYFFSEMNKLGDNVKWATQKEAYEDFVDFSNHQ